MPRADMSEPQLQYAVTDLATLRGWLFYHTHDSRHSAAGFPDLVLVRDDRLLFVELKAAQGTVSAPQKKWLLALGQVAASTPTPPLEVYLWRPEHLADGTIAKALR